jgi:hypothetical protein
LYQWIIDAVQITTSSSCPTLKVSAPNTSSVRESPATPNGGINCPFPEHTATTTTWGRMTRLRKRAEIKRSTILYVSIFKLKRVFHKDIGMKNYIFVQLP